MDSVEQGLEQPPSGGIVDPALPSWARTYTGEVHKFVQPLRATKMEFRWDSGRGRSPRFASRDDGLEIGVTLHNDGIRGTRPACVDVSFPPNPSTNFYMEMWPKSREYAAYSHNFPRDALPYADIITLSDKCSANSLEVGVKHLTMLKPDVKYTIRTQHPHGRMSSSVMSVTASIVNSDFCLPGKVSSACMGIFPPTCFGACNQLFLNKSRGWLAPGCSGYQVGMSAPWYRKLGVFPCPTHV